MRWPFAAALVAVIVGTAGLWARPHVESWWKDRQFAAFLKEGEADWQKEQPAVDALAAMPLPAGLTFCEAGPEALTKTHMACWRGQTEIEPTTLALAMNLRSIGATEVSPRCTHPKSTKYAISVLCRVTANLHGQTLFATLGPDPRTADVAAPHGVQVSGDFLPEDDDYSRIGIFSTPLPMPAN